jgi:hypothetical protein
MCWNSSLATRDCGFPPPPDTSKIQIQIQIQIQIHTLTCTFKINHKTEQKFNISYYHFGLAETEPAKERIRRQKAKRCGRSEVRFSAAFFTLYTVTRHPTSHSLLGFCNFCSAWTILPFIGFDHFVFILFVFFFNINSEIIFLFKLTYPKILLKKVFYFYFCFNYLLLILRKKYIFLIEKLLDEAFIDLVLSSKKPCKGSLSAGHTLSPT